MSDANGGLTSSGETPENRAAGSLDTPVNEMGGTLDPTNSGDSPAPSSEESLLRGILSASRDGISILAEDGTVLFANERAAQMAGYPRAEAGIGTHLRDILAPENLAMVQAIRSARHGGKSVPRVYETVLRRPDGDLPVEIHAVPIIWRGAPCDLVFMRDAAERRRSVVELSRRESVLQAVAQAVEQLIATPDWQQAIQEALGKVSTAIGVDRAHIWRADQQEDGEILPVPVAIWMSPERALAGPGLDYSRLPLLEYGFGPWIEILRRGGHFVAPLRDYPPRMREALEAVGARAVAAVPIFVGADWFGLLGFTDCRSERDWTQLEVDALRVLASTIGAIMRRQRIEDALRASEERLRSTIDQAADGILIVDRSGRILEFNPRTAEMLGYAPGELLNKSLYELALPSERALIDEDYAKLDRGQPLVLERRLLRGDGRIAPFDVNVTRLTDGRVQGILRDASERVRNQEELNRRDRILEAVGFTADRALAATVWEEEISAILERLGRAMGVDGIGLHEIRDLGMSTEHSLQRFRWVDPSGGGEAASPGLRSIPLRDPGAARVADTLRRNEVFQAPVDQWPGGPRRALEESGIRSLLLVPIFDGERWWGVLGISDQHTGRVWSPLEIDALRSVAGILGGLVRRRNIEVDLRASEERYRALVEGFHDAILLIDRWGILRFGNASAAARLGIDQAEIPGRSIREFSVSGAMVEEQMEAIVRALDLRQPTLLEQRQETTQGTRWYEVRIQPMVDAGGRCDSALAFVLDITDRKEAEERILRYQSRLRTLSSELTLTEQRERRRIASELHDRIGQSLILSKMRLSAMRASPGRDREAELEEIARLLDQTIHDTRSLTFDISPPILYDLGLAPALEWLAERIQSRHGISVAVEIDGEIRRLQMDRRVILFRAVQELLVNVVKHARAASAAVRLVYGVDSLSITVADDGVGFDPARLASHGAETGGFGLFNVRERLEYAGCEFHLDSAPGDGTRARILAPLADCVEDGKEIR